uniref:Uncharacterized protein n=1 Tax=Arundo donax TaxID=35708 RepID=A0A0A9HCN3_ARUDO
MSKLPKARSDVAVVSACGNAEQALSVPSDSPEACFSASTYASRSFNDVCLTFSAIAPIAWAAATLVSQFLLRVYWETFFSNAFSSWGWDLAISPIWRAAANLVACVEPVSSNVSRR